MFEDATFHSGNLQHSQTPKWMLAALALNLSVVSTMILLPLLYPEGMPSRLLSRILYAPPQSAPVLTRPQPAHPMMVELLSPHNPFIAPVGIPRITSTTPDAAPPPSGLESGSFANSIPGADQPATSAFRPTTPAPAVRPAAPRTYNISQGVAVGLLLSRNPPAYPAIARAAGVSGTVSLAATISTSGTIANLRVVSGPTMLRQAAIDAVQSWRYRPYLLNNQPVEVETTINVVFSLGAR